MYLNPAQIPTSLMEPAMDAGQPAEKSTPASSADRPACTDVSIGYHPVTKHLREVMLAFADGVTEVYAIADHSGAALHQNWHIRLGARTTCDPPTTETRASR